MTRCATSARALSFWCCIALFAIGQAVAETTATASDAHASWSNEEVARLQQGDILVRPLESARGEPARVMAGISIPADAASIWQVMTDCGAAPDYVPNLRTCEVKERGDNYELIQHTVKLSWLLPQVTYTFKATYSPPDSIEFERVAGGLRHLSGAWTLSTVSDRLTVVSYRVALRPGFPVPRWLVRRSLKKDLPAVLAALRDRVQAESFAHSGQLL